MKQFSLALAAMAMAMAVPATGALAQATSYPLICRVGGSMTATLTAGATIRISFVPGAVAANPGPGQCVWIDRGFRSGEPGLLTLSGSPAGARYFVDVMLAGGTFYAHVYNNNAGTMVVTRVGP